MKHRLLFYLIYSSLVTAIGYSLFYKIRLPVVVENTVFLMLSITLQYCLSLLFLKTAIKKRLVITIAIWLLAFITGMLTLVHFAFNKKADPADLIGLISFFLIMFICYEIYFYVSKRTLKK